MGPDDELDVVVGDEPEVDVELEADEDIDDAEADGADEVQATGGGRVARLAKERAEFRDQLQVERGKREEYERLLHEHMLRQQQPAQEEDADPLKTWTNRVEKTLQQQTASMQDQLDQSRYELKANSNTLYKRYGPKVEEELRILRRGGSNATREAILAYMVGQEALNGVGKKPAKKSADSAAPTGMKSTVAKSKSEPTLKERLSNIRL